MRLQENKLLDLILMRFIPQSLVLERHLKLCRIVRDVVITNVDSPGSIYDMKS